MRQSPPPRTHGRAVGNPIDNNSVPLNQPRSKLPEAQCNKADRINTCAATSSPPENGQEGPKAYIIHTPAPSSRYSQSQSNGYQPPAWPRAISELFVLVWSIAVVALSVGFDRVIRVADRTSPESIGVDGIVEGGRNHG
ncbi:hypothetical protein PM082_022826 [Marasmius tenuissimus]|nr:hypothetical protein PM082_022826 [Marasmius tenuissimus]